MLSYFWAPFVIYLAVFSLSALLFHFCLKLLKMTRNLKLGESFLKEISGLILAQSTPALQVRGLKQQYGKNYKFYGLLLGRLLDHSRSFGVSCRNGLIQMRDFTLKDIRSERLFLKTIHAGVVQFSLVAFMTWAFLLSMFLTGLTPGSLQLVCVAFSQVFGSILFMGYFFWAKKRRFSHFYLSFEVILSFFLTAQIEISLKEQFELAGVNRLQNKRFPSGLNELIDLFFQLLEKRREMGVGIEQELGFLLDELNHQSDQAHQDFAKVFEVVKFTVLLIFFAIPFFATHFFILRDSFGAN
jgi:hypothetical protein